MPRSSADRARRLRDVHQGAAGDAFDPALERVGGGLWRLADRPTATRRSARTTPRSRISGTAVGADYRFSPNTMAGFALAGGGTNFSVNKLRHRPLRPVPGRRVRPSHRRPGLCHRRAGLWLAGHHHRPHRDRRRHRSSARRVQRQCVVRPRRRRLSLRHAVDRRRRPHALCRGAVHHLRSAGLCRAGVVGSQHLCAGLRRQERHR